MPRPSSRWPSASMAARAAGTDSLTPGTRGGASASASSAHDPWRCKRLPHENNRQPPHRANVIRVSVTHGGVLPCSGGATPLARRARHRAPRRHSLRSAAYSLCLQQYLCLDTDLGGEGGQGLIGQSSPQLDGVAGLHELDELGHLPVGARGGGRVCTWQGQAARATGDGWGVARAPGRERSRNQTVWVGTHLRGRAGLRDRPIRLHVALRNAGLQHLCEH
eukprot:scaffold32032_cov108-Isochrysis_galbana.AAC.2